MFLHQIFEGLRDPKDNPCWKGYKPVGTKQKNGKTVPNCVPNSNESVDEAFIAPALSAANANAEFARQNSFIPHGYKGRVNIPIKSQSEYTGIYRSLKQAGKHTGEHVECGTGDGRTCNVYSKTMDSDALRKFIKQHALRGLDEGTNNDLRKSVLEVLEWIYKGALDGGEMIDFLADEFSDMYDEVMDSGDRTLMRAYMYMMDKGQEAEGQPDIMATVAHRAIQSITGAGEELEEVSLGDYHRKASMSKAISQMGAAFGGDPERRAKDLDTARRREQGLARAKTRTDKIAADMAAKRKEEHEAEIRAKYAGVDIDAEIAQLQPAIKRAYHEYQYGARNTYSQGKEEYDRLMGKVRELERAKEILQGKGVTEGAKSHSELARLAHEAYISAVRQGNSLMANHYKQAYEKHKRLAASERKSAAKGVAEGAGNIGSSIKKLYQKIYRAGDDEIEYFYNDSPIFAQYWDEYEGDLDSIIAEVDPSELEVIQAELESYVEQANLAEGEPGDLEHELNRQEYHHDKIAGLYEPDEFDQMVSRLGQKAKEQERKHGPVDLAKLAQRLRDIK